MRLLNKETLELEWFTNDPPPYIILSHRWLGRETTLQEFVVQSKQDRSTWSDGVAKVIRFCNEARAYEEQYLWVDTCCIDKTSSTELQEAINSMFDWYRGASYCMVFLDDCEVGNKHAPIHEQLAASTWFTRGWTLQELIAPRELIFVDCNWTDMGGRDQYAGVIETTTQIPALCLGVPTLVYGLTIAERMTWLSSRKTTREEDLAYCMLGLFNVNMPMLYGEGNRAFVRLQKELLQVCEDESIFVWARDHLNAPLGYWDQSSILAPIPQCFACLSNRKVQIDGWFGREHPRLTAKGLEIETWDRRGAQFGRELIVPLNVLVDGKRVGIKLASRDSLHDGGYAEVTKWVRTHRNNIHTIDNPAYDRPPTAIEQYERHVREAEDEARAQRLNALQSRHHEVSSSLQRLNAGRRMTSERSPGLQLADGQMFVPGYTPRPLFGSLEYIEWYKSECILFKIYVE